MPITFEGVTGIPDLPSNIIPGTSPGLSAAFTNVSPPVFSTYSPGTGEASLFDSTKQLVSGLFNNLPAISRAVVDVRQAFTSSGNRNVPVVLPSGVIITGDQQKGSYVPGYTQMIPGFLQPQSQNGTKAPADGGLFNLTPMQTILLLGALAGLILWDLRRG